MEPVSLIISALSAAAGELGKEAVRDSYNELKQIILKRFLKEKNDAGKIAVEKFESKPDVWKEALKDALLESQADKDDTIIKTAKELINLIVSAQAPMASIDSNTGNVIVQHFHISGKTAPIAPLKDHSAKEAAHTKKESGETSTEQEQRLANKGSKKIRIGCFVVLAALCLLIAAWFIFDTFTNIPSSTSDDFPVFKQGLKQRDIWELKFITGLFERENVWIEPITGMEFVWIPKGCFQMGSNSSEAGSDENPVHEVCVDGFWMAKYEVTNKQYRKYKPDHNSRDYKNYSSRDYKGIDLNGDEQPAVHVSWEDAKAFVKWLSQQSKKDFGLPTEAQWEYAARAGTDTERFWGNNVDEACKYANGRDETLKNKWDWKDIHNRNWEDIHNCNDGYACTASVGSFKANNFGLYDMLGNVWEWCEDVYDYGAYKKHEHTNPLISSGSGYHVYSVHSVHSVHRVVRGGSWYNSPRKLRTAYRGKISADDRDNDLGFRLCLSPVRRLSQQ